jgi:hypothetical protein
MDIPPHYPPEPPSQSKTGTGTPMVLFSPSPRSFYRVKEFTDLETARKWCEGCGAEPSVQFYLRLIICDAMWQDFSACTGTFGSNRNMMQKYMVLWKDMEPNYHNMREFEKLEDAMQYASATRLRLQELKTSSSPNFSHHCLPETLRVVAFTLVGEWNVANKPAED